MSEQKCDQKVETVSIDCPIGRIDVFVCPNGLHRMSRFDQQFDPNARTGVHVKSEDIVSTNKWLNESIDWFRLYFESNDQNIGQKLVKTPEFCPNINRSEFCRKVWSTLTNKIRFGETISYSQLAMISVGNERASRAVGTAMKNNPFLVMVPCHRVVKKSGDIGHYSGGGISVKQWLLSFEKDFKDK